jgi:uncharacterized protein YfeS
MGFELELGTTRFGNYQGRCTSDASFALLREGLVGLSFGPGIQTIVVDIHLRWHGAAPAPFSAEDVERYHCFDFTLPKVTFQKKRARAVVLWPTALDSQRFLGEPEEASVASFEALSAEVEGALASLRPRLARIEDFDLEALLSSIEKTVLAIPREPVAFRAAVTSSLAGARTRREALLRARDPWDALDIDWDTYHPNARRLLDEPFFWDCTDDLAPVGNDTGADVLEGFRKWRRRKKAATTPVLDFLHHLLAEWDVPLNAGDAKLALVRDEACVGLAFSQVMLEGRVDTDVAECALQAIARQRLTVGQWPEPSKREETLQRTHDALHRVLGQANHQDDP